LLLRDARGLDHLLYDTLLTFPGTSAFPGESEQGDRCCQKDRVFQQELTRKREERKPRFTVADPRGDQEDE
jgi:hypothetical protein